MNERKQNTGEQKFNKHSNRVPHIELPLLVSNLIYARALLEYVILFCCRLFGCIILARCYLPWNSRKIKCSFSLFSVKNA